MIRRKMSLWTVCLRKRLFRIFPDSHFWNYPPEKSNPPGFINMKYFCQLFTLIAWIDVMFMITNLIKPRIGKLILTHLIGNNCPEFRNGLLDCYFIKLTLRMIAWNFVSGHPVSVILQKCITKMAVAFKPGP